MRGHWICRISPVHESPTCLTCHSCPFCCQFSLLLIDRDRGNSERGRQRQSPATDTVANGMRFFGNKRRGVSCRKFVRRASKFLKLNLSSLYYAMDQSESNSNQVPICELPMKTRCDAPVTPYCNVCIH